MKIMLITESLGSGGAERQLVGLSVLLKKKGFIVDVISYVDNQFHENYLRENDINYAFKSELRPKLLRIIRMVAMFRRQKPDVVISYLPHVNKAVCLAKLFCNYRLLVSERSHTSNFNMYLKIQFFIYHLADYIIPNSFAEADNIANHCPSLKGRIRTIPNFVNTVLFQPGDKSNKIDDSLTLLSVGRIIPSKNVLSFLNTFAELINEGYHLKLKWVGSMYDRDYCNQVKNRIKELKLDDWVILNDQTNKIAIEYQNADIFCFPTLYEGYPNVLVEAMSCGLPIVCSNVCEMPRIIKDGVNGFLFNPHSEIEMKEALKRMLATPKGERDKMGEINREYVLNNNSSDSFVQKYIELFK